MLARLIGSGQNHQHIANSLFQAAYDGLGLPSEEADSDLNTLSQAAHSESAR
ncbi:hypothetical protein D3C85_1024760 [compost metagenome]